MRTIDWVDGAIEIIDQTALPDEVRMLRLTTVEELVSAIQRLAVRGAPALGVAGALGVALAAFGADDVSVAAATVRSARPTAVNLAWGVDRAVARLADGADAVLAEALAILEEDVVANRTLSERGAALLRELVGAPVRLLTHCNTGGLASVDWGTALGIVRRLHDDGDLDHVFADETRPLLQGSRLTAWELREMGVDHTLVVDSAGPTVIARGLVDAVVVGADRVTANGDVVNKIGTYPLALAAERAGVPFVVAAPESTVDEATATGDDVEIELRPPEEITAAAPEGTAAANFAFDVTPADLVTAIVTERRTL